MQTGARARGCGVTRQALSLRFPLCRPHHHGVHGMKKISLLGAALASFLAFPAAASAHTATADITCSGVKAYYTAFHTNVPPKTNTVDYKVTVDGVTTKSGSLLLSDKNG